MFTILAISDSDKHFESAIKEYAKRLGKQIFFENLKPFKGENQNFVIEKETAKVIALLQKKYPSAAKILLVKEGKLYDTLAFADAIQGKDVVFIIGGPYGIDRTRLKTAFPTMKELSFGAITLPHGLAKLTLIEQIYRAATLWSGKKYHY